MVDAHVMAVISCQGKQPADDGYADKDEETCVCPRAVVWASAMCPRFKAEEARLLDARHA
ncbi:hypothetical protein Dimus_037711, partial [Dionaea muscipula]